MNKTGMPTKKSTITASEIGQYSYCSNAWYLQKCGHTPNSPKLHKGKHAHTTMGTTIDTMQQHIQRSRIYLLISLLFLALACIVLYYGVIP